MDLIKSAKDRNNIEGYNTLALSSFLNQLNQRGAKSLFVVGINEENKIEIAFVNDIGIDAIRELCRQIAAELDKGSEKRNGSGIILPPN